MPFEHCAAAKLGAEYKLTMSLYSLYSHKTMYWDLGRSKCHKECAILLHICVIVQKKEKEKSKKEIFLPQCGQLLLPKAVIWLHFSTSIMLFGGS